MKRKEYIFKKTNHIFYQAFGQKYLKISIWNHRRIFFDDRWLTFFYSSEIFFGLYFYPKGNCYSNSYSSSNFEIFSLEAIFEEEFFSLRFFFRNFRHRSHASIKNFFLWNFLRKFFSGKVFLLQILSDSSSSNKSNNLVNHDDFLSWVSNFMWNGEFSDFFQNSRFIFHD